MKNKENSFIFFTVFIILFCIFLIFYLIPKDSSISLKINIEDLEVESFNGNILGELDFLFLDDAKLVNESDISIQTDNKIYNLSKGELIIKFFDTQYNEDKENYFNNILYCDKMIINVNVLDIGKINLKKHYHEPSYVKNIDYNKNFYEFELLPQKSKNYEYKIQMPINSNVTSTSGSKIYIKGEKIDNPFFRMIILSSKDSKKKSKGENYALFSVTSKKIKTQLYEEYKLHINGYIEKFFGEGGSESILKRTYRNSQTKYDISFLNFRGIKSDNGGRIIDYLFKIINISSNSTEMDKAKFLKIKGELDGKNNILNISGRVDDIRVASHDLRFNIIDFIYDNLNTIILPIITGLILYVIKNKNEEK